MIRASTLDLEADHHSQSELAQACRSDMAVPQETTAGFDEAAEESLVKLEARVTQFATQDMRQDIPTGKTPMKQVHKYPTSFHASRPAEEVIQVSLFGVGGEEIRIVYYLYS